MFPRICLSLFGLILVLDASAHAAPPASPATRVDPVTDTLHGETLVDPYRWLEDQQAPETREWIAAQNAHTDAFLAKFPGRQALVERASQLMKIDSQGMPTVRGGRYFFSRRAADQDLPVICVADGPDGEPTVLIDPKSIDDGKSKTVSLLEISDDGHVLVYGVRHAGEDEVTVKFFDVAKRRDLPLEMPRGRYFGVSLTPNKRTLFYTLHGKEGSRVTRRDVTLDGAAPSLGEPKVVFGEGYDTGVIVSPSLSEDGAYLLLHVFYGSAAKKTDIYFQPLRQGANAPIRPLVNDIEARFLAGAVDRRAFVTTNWNAPRNRVLLVDLEKPERTNWKEIVPQREGVLEDLSAVGGRLYANYLVDVKSSVTVFDLEGHEVRRIAFPTLGTVSGVGGRWDGKEAFFAFSGFQTPSTIYRESVESGEQTVWSKLNVPVNTDAFEAKQVFYTSKDGTRVPMFVVHRKGLKLDGNNPTLLYGYGGFNNSLTPFFSAKAVLWMEHGGVYCVANLRGGGEYGEEWHQAGMQSRKQNVFDDFHAAAEWLIAAKYTRPEKLAISGGSNGGLLVGAALTQRPELFRAVVCSYPLLDMVRYHKFLVARFWIPEYGSSDDPEEFKTLRAYSPYHNVVDGGKYPATLFITGDADTRVDPLHARKMAALLQAKSGSGRPVLLRYDTKLGHTGARPVSKSVEDLADELSFLLGELEVAAPVAGKDVSASRTGDATDSDRLNDLFAREWQYGLRESPTFASFLGDKRYNDRWPDVSLEAIERRHIHQREVLAELAAFKAEALEPADRLNLRLFRRQLETEIEEHGHRTFLVPLTQREGIQDESSVADSLSFDTVKDYDDWTARLHSFPRYMDQTIALMRRGIAERRVQPKITMERLPAQIRKQIVDDPAKSLYFKPYRTFSDDIPAAERTRIEQAGRDAIEKRIVPAYRAFLEFFEREYLPACFDKVGAWQLPEGSSFYAFKARQFTTTDLSPDQIHEIGLAEVARIRKEMDGVIAITGFSGTFPEFLEHLRTDPKFYFKNPQDLLNAYLVLCKRVDPQLPKLFRKLPRTPYGIEAIPEHMAPDTTTAYYRPPAADGSRAGTYFVNLYRPEVRPTYEMEALSLHEAVPGHHLQIALANELTGVPEFRKHAGFTAYVEGWALYGERLGDDLGLYRDPYSKFGQLTYEMWRAVRLVVDTGIHSKQWSRQRAIDFFKENAAKSEHDIVNEVDRYISWPGQALAYKIGEIRIRELRAYAEQSLGDKFDVRDFHEVVLGQGAVPLDVLAELVMEWIAKAKTASK